MSMLDRGDDKFFRTVPGQGKEFFDDFDMMVVGLHSFWPQEENDTPLIRDENEASSLQPLGDYEESAGPRSRPALYTARDPVDSDEQGGADTVTRFIL
jgi:hypothetical protein